MANRRINSRPVSRGRTRGIAGSVAVVGALVVGAAVAVPAYYGDKTATCTVNDKDRVTNSEGGSDMRVYTSCGNFSVGDVLVKGQFDSSDLYAQLEPGRTYELTYHGWRVPIFSMFETITDAQEVTAP